MRNVKLEKINDLKEKGILSDSEFEIEKKKILNESEINNYTYSLSGAGENLLNIFNAIIWLVISITVLVIMVFFKYLAEEKAYIISLFINLFVFIKILLYLYKAGKNLKHVDDKQQKKFKDNSTSTIDNKCPSCDSTIDLNDIKCLNCEHPLNFEDSCPACNSTINSNDKKCVNCGMPFL
jgi:fumarate reductase subunit D